jgi:hypothetical protein
MKSKEKKNRPPRKGTESKPFLDKCVNKHKASSNHAIKIRKSLVSRICVPDELREDFTGQPTSKCSSNDFCTETSGLSRLATLPRRTIGNCSVTSEHTAGACTLLSRARHLRSIKLVPSEPCATETNPYTAPHSSASNRNGWLSGPYKQKK